MRGWTFIVVLVLLAPSVSAQTAQDELLTRATAVGDAAFYSAYPDLLIVQLAIVSRLQSSAVNSTELAADHRVVEILETLFEWDGRRDDADSANLRQGLVELTAMRRTVENDTDAATASFRPLLRRSIDLELAAFVARAEAVAPQLSRTAEAVALLGAARDAARIIGDPFAYSRIDDGYRTLNGTYQRDEPRAQALLAAADVTRDRVDPSLKDPALAQEYADRLHARDDALEAQRLFTKHGETEDAMHAATTASTLADNARHLALRMAAALAAAVALVLLLGLLAAWRIVRWGEDRAMGRWGDELSLQGG